MKIKVILPVISTQFNSEVEKEVQQFVSSEAVVEIEHLDKGTASIESAFDEALCAPDIIEKAVQAEKDGFDAVFIDCFGDPAVEAAREMVAIPVVGGFQPAVLTASVLANKFTVISVLPSVVPMIRGLARKQGIEGNLASIRYVNIAVLDLSDASALKANLLSQLEAAVTQDGAEAVVLGCTGMLGLAHSVEEAAAEKGFQIPVIDPTGAAVGFLELLVRNGLKKSGAANPTPSEKPRNFYPEGSILKKT
ncbi:MAG: aspartate/glutamate racemase family protein [Spirochaetales bacterium]|nr:aspartate/glutamate racemase family protein [Spirochaetales bacterium]MCF7937911.1 aspartate/glutamate racemase family protein [Spirochaetales bacterium]